ncbi:unnamed protein product [Linum trigynum]|uniref:Uncharacterized protein n=1 Tax=Linum trigynum TaxID=586398 RepID=A0AAV2CUA7_9ROSI
MTKATGTLRSIQKLSQTTPLIIMIRKVLWWQITPFLISALTCWAHARRCKMIPLKKLLGDLLSNLFGKKKEVVEDEEESVVLDLFQGERPHFEEGRGVEEAIGVQAEDEVEVEEAYTGPMLHVISPPNFEELLGKDPFVVSLCHTKTTSTSIPLGGCDGGQSMISYLVWGNETRADAEERSREWRLHLTQGHEPSSSSITSPDCDLGLHIIDENLNFKEALGWTDT